MGDTATICIDKDIIIIAKGTFTRKGGRTTIVYRIVTTIVGWGMNRSSFPPMIVFINNTRSKKDWRISNHILRMLCWFCV